MSDTSEQMKGVTPTFQMVLNKQIGDAMDAINDGNLHRAYSVCKTLIDALKEEHSKPLLTEDIPAIDKLIEDSLRVGQDKRHGWYRTMLRRTYTRDQILAQSIRKLFRKIMRLLHDNNYLEYTKKIPRRRFGT